MIFHSHPKTIELDERNCQEKPLVKACKTHGFSHTISIKTNRIIVYMMYIYIYIYNVYTYMHKTSFSSVSFSASPPSLPLSLSLSFFSFFFCLYIHIYILYIYIWCVFSAHAHPHDLPSAVFHFFRHWKRYQETSVTIHAYIYIYKYVCYIHTNFCCKIHLFHGLNLHFRCLTSQKSCPPGHLAPGLRNFPELHGDISAIQKEVLRWWKFGWQWTNNSKTTLHL